MRVVEAKGFSFYIVKKLGPIVEYALSGKALKQQAEFKYGLEDPS